MAKKINLFMAILTLFFLSLQVEGKDLNLIGCATRKLTLSSGLEVVLQYVPDCEVGCVFLQVDSGARYDTEENLGRAHLLEHLLYRRTGRFSNGLLALNLENIGSKRGAKTDLESIYFWEIVPSQYLDLALKIESDRLSGLVFSDSELNLEKYNLAQELKGLSVDPLRCARMEVIKKLNLPVPGGEIIDIKSISPQSLFDFYREKFIPERSHLVVISSQPFNLLQEKLERYFGDNLSKARQQWEKSITDLKFSPLKLDDDRLSAEEVWQKNRVNLLCLGWKLNLVNCEDYAKFLVLNEAHNLAVNNFLAEENLKEKVRFFKDDSGDSEFYNLSFQLSPAVQREEFLDLLSKNVSNADLSVAKSLAKLNFYRSWQNYAERGKWLNNRYLSRKDLNNFTEIIDNLTVNELRDFERANFSLEKSKVFFSPQGDSFATIYQGNSPRVVFATDDSIKVWTLPNGVKLAYEYSKVSPIVTIYGFLKTDGKIKLTESSQNLPQGFYWEFLPQDDGLVIKGWSLKGEFARALNFLGDYLQSIRVIEDKGNISQVGRWNLASERFFGAVFSKGDCERTITIDPRNLVLSFVGDLSNVEQIADSSSLANWICSEQEMDESLAFERVKPSRIKISSVNNDGKFLIVAGQQGPKFSNSVEFCAYKVLLQILGGGNSSRLAVREIHLEKIANKVAAFNVVHEDSSVWVVTMLVDKDKSERALSILRQELNRLASPGPTSEEVKRAVSACQGKLQIDWSQPENRALWLSENLLQGQTKIEPDLYMQNFCKVTPQHVREVAKKWCRASDWVLVVEVEE